jgi:subtilisin family serine protease
MHSSLKAQQDGLQTEAQLIPFQEAAKQANSQLPMYDEHRLFVKFKNLKDVRVKSFQGASARMSALSIDPLSRLMREEDAQYFVQPFAPLRSNNLDKIFELHFGKHKKNIREILKEVQALPEVEYAELVPIYYTDRSTSNDPLLSQQYAMTLTNSLISIPQHTGTNRVVVAIVDDGVLTTHEDLAANIWTNPGEIPGDGIDNDGNGYIDDVNGWDAADNDNNPRPPANIAGPNQFSHGTHCAGIAGAVHNNSTGIAAISANKVWIMPVKATRDDIPAPYTSITSSVAGVTYAIAANAKVVSMSFGGSGFSQAFQDLINQGAAQGIIFVASAGNNNNDILNYPASYTNVISVANTTSTDRKSGSSSFGTRVDISAPGTNIRSTVAQNAATPTGTYTDYTGTSMSCPMVSGLIGFMLSENPNLTFAQVREIIRSTSDPIDHLNPGFEGLLGAGRINAYNALMQSKVNKTDVPQARFENNRTINNAPIEIFVGQQVTFVDRSLGSNLSRTWSFPGGTATSTTARVVTVTYNTPGNYAVTLTASNPNGSNAATVSNLVRVTAPAATDVLNFPLTGTFDAPLIAQSGGTNNIQQFANTFEYVNGHSVVGGRVSFNNISNPTSTASTVTFTMWSLSETGAPSVALAQKTVPFSELTSNSTAATFPNPSDVTTPVYYDVTFDNAVSAPNGRFAFGVRVNAAAAGDLVSINTVPAFSGNRSFAVFGGVWRVVSGFNSTAANGNNRFYLMFPFVTENSLIPTAEFTLSATEACIGAPITANATASGTIESYQWQISDGSAASSTTLDPGTITFSSAGNNKSVALRVSNSATVNKSGTNINITRSRQVSRTIRVNNCTVTSLDALEIQNLLLYPNPANTALNIRYEENTREASVRVIDARGNEVANFALERRDGAWVGQLEVEKYATGIYYLQLRDERGAKGKTFLKQ